MSTDIEFEGKGLKEDLLLELEGEVATLWIDRPKTRNALTLSIWRRLPGKLAEVESNATAKVLVIRGAGGKAFASGADIGEFENLRLNAEDAEQYDLAVMRAEEALASFAKPSIAMVQGPCIGGGCELAVACDFRFSDHSGRFGITASKIGLVYGLAPTKRLVDLIGVAHAKRMLFTGEIWTAEEAYKRSLVDEIWSGDDLEENTYEFAQCIAERAQLSVRAAKKMILASLAGLTAESVETLRLRSEGYASEDYREGVRAFLEKRPAHFRYS